MVLGETKSYNHASLTTAVRLVAEGARFIPNNSDRVGPSADGIEPVCGAVAVLIAAATGVTPYFVDKPNPLTMREALRHLGTHSRDTVIIGDRIETDIVADIGSWMESILVLKGVTGREDLTRYPHRPGHVVDSVAAVILAAA
ncbi:MAG TPA: HAD hydrolase-like protein [Nitrospira sp.]|nr:HAD hydrolase-like protein [Nitrospira sp.]